MAVESGWVGVGCMGNPEQKAACISLPMSVVGRGIGVPAQHQHPRRPSASRRHGSGSAPMAGAPRTVMSLIAVKAALGPSIWTHEVSVGRLRCSKSCRAAAPSRRWKRMASSGISVEAWQELQRMCGLGRPALPSASMLSAALASGAAWLRLTKGPWAADGTVCHCSRRGAPALAPPPTPPATPVPNLSTNGNTATQCCSAPPHARSSSAQGC